MTEGGRVNKTGKEYCCKLFKWGSKELTESMAADGAREPLVAVLALIQLPTQQLD